MSLSNPLIIVAPLNWGMGHATRCVPIIDTLLKKECRVHLVAEGRGGRFLRSRYPTLPLEEFPGYEITYPGEGQNMMLRMAKQVPGIIKGIRKENECLLELVERTGADAVLSDNRYGMHHPRIPSIFITHQVNIKAPFGETLLAMMNHKYIRKFNECWIPDREGPDNLSGDLGHSFRRPLHAKYIGTLSRFETTPAKEKDIDILFLLSGPEPQRSILQELLVTEAQKLTQREPQLKIVWLCGTPGDTPSLSVPGKVYDHASDPEIQALILRSRVVISRPGYSTLMDLDRLGAKAVFIPTPGQTEQEYLAQRMMDLGIAPFMKQGRIDLSFALGVHIDYSGFKGNIKGKELESALDELIGLLQRK